ncbi:uncharacterized protein LOC126882883 isoform X2 [Diabrotica virgifera virgifera]|uniref:Uncharacterized protein n=1 Tax=Diabrotica virgifera virgifera TaxID=50390 RepID=A0ABM5K140_DIAVI|nr:uncharacterized protein LOC126882883 isoform X2 [Diabrotica virgifera virgifera]
MKWETFLAVVILVSSLNSCKAHNNTEAAVYQTGPLGIIKGIINGFHQVQSSLMKDIVQFVERIVDKFDNTFNLTNIRLFPSTEQLRIIGNTLITLEENYIVFMNNSINVIIKKLPEFPPVSKFPEFPNVEQIFNLIVTLVSLYFDFLQTLIENIIIKLPALPPFPNIEDAISKTVVQIAGQYKDVISNVITDIIKGVISGSIKISPNIKIPFFG